MKLITCTITTLMCHFAHASVETDIQNYLKIAEQKQLHQDITWQRIHNIILEMPQPIDVLTLYQTLKQTELE